jgi:antitoxin (DNA-binding transcriptional repressor) of toxin-antitoxin stability system
MIQISVSQARRDFLELANRIYSGQEYLVVKNKIPMLVMLPVKPEKPITRPRRILPGATKLMVNLKGDSVKIVNEWRQKEEMRSYGR